jgi:hypothetical protein
MSDYAPFPLDAHSILVTSATFDAGGEVAPSPAFSECLDEPSLVRIWQVTLIRIGFPTGMLLKFAAARTTVELRVVRSLPSRWYNRPRVGAHLAEAKSLPQ